LASEGKYDVFQKLPDGSSKWAGTVDRGELDVDLIELVDLSGSWDEFYVYDPDAQTTVAWVRPQEIIPAQRN
jgi:hypothetical protein